MNFVALVDRRATTAIQVPEPVAAPMEIFAMSAPRRALVVIATLRASGLLSRSAMMVLMAAADTVAVVREKAF